MAIFRYRNLKFLLLLAAFAPCLSAQDTWHGKQMLALDGMPLTRLRGIGVPAEAEYKGKKLKAYVFFSGYDGHAGGPGYPSLGIHVENIDKFMPESEIDTFVGPDLSQYAVHNNAIRITLRKGERRFEFNTRLLYTYGRFFDPGFDSYNYFETNHRNTKTETDSWRQFLTQMSDGFETGTIVVGGKAFSSELMVKFDGNGLGTQLKELVEYCSKR